MFVPNVDSLISVPVSNVTTPYQVSNPTAEVWAFPDTRNFNEPEMNLRCELKTANAKKMPFWQGEGACPCYSAQCVFMCACACVCMLFKILKNCPMSCHILIFSPLVVLFSPFCCFSHEARCFHPQLNKNKGKSLIELRNVFMHMISLNVLFNCTVMLVTDYWKFECV